MALSFEESKKLLAEQVATPMMMAAQPTRALSAEDPGIMTLDAGDEVMEIAAYESWDKPKNSSFYTYYNNEYYDESISTVDKNKNITLSSEQINITQEKNSQYIPFEIPRYYDGFDLSTTELSIYWVNNLGSGSTAIPVDVYYSTDKIRFAWLVDDDVTAISGKIQFEIHASGENSQGHKYLWKTKPNDGINVLQALEIKGFIEPDSAWQDSFIGRMSTQAARAEAARDEADTYSTIAQAAAASATSVKNELLDGIEAEVQEAVSGVLGDYALKSYVDDAVDSIDVTGQLENYALKSDIPTKISELENDAGYLTEHQSLESYALKEEIPTKISVLENDSGYLTEIPDEYVTNDELTAAIKEIDVSNQLGDLGVDEEGNSLTVKQYVDEAVTAVDVSDQLGDLSDEEGNARTVKQYVDDSVAAIDVTEQLADYAKSADVYTKTEVNNKTEALSSSIEANTTNITSLSGTVSGLQTAVNSIDKSPRLTYNIAYNEVDNPEVGENGFVLYEITNEGMEGESKIVKRRVVVTGGSGGVSATTLKVERVTPSPLIMTSSARAVIEYEVSSLDSDGQTVDCSYTWKKGGVIIASGSCIQGRNVFDATEFTGIGTHKFTLTVTDEGGSVDVKTWTIQVVDIRIETSFNDQVKYEANKPVNFTYTPYGAIEKTIHFKFDGVELAPVTTNVSGIVQSYVLPAQSHGAHLLEVWVTAIVNNVEIAPEHIYKDIIWFDETSNVPVIGCIYRYDHYGPVAARQYNATDITYVVYDSNEANATVSRYVDGESIGTQTLENAVDVWSYKTADIGEKVLKIECGATSVEIKLDVAALGIAIEPVTAGLAFDFNPTGMSNNDEDRVWSDKTTGVKMFVSPNFDWVNGGYQRDDNGDQYFCVKAGTWAKIDYSLFGSDYDPKALGKEFKFVFKTTNVKKRSSTFLSCIEHTVAEDGTKTSVGIDMTVENTNIYASNKSIFVPYSEEDIIEFEFNINKDTDIPLLMTYEDGVANRPLIYAADSSFMQLEPQPIVVGSADCDVHIYRMKAYDTSLTDKEILSNFIADARNADEMIARYNRNKIYESTDKDGNKILSINGTLTPESIAEACPWLRVIMIDAPWFTNDKDDKVAGTTVRQIYKGGDPVYDNWTCTGAKHSGQGTSSNKYGYAGRNLRLIMNEDESLFTFNGTDESGNPITGKTVTLGKDSVPNAFWNIKVNIASSENQNNAQMARRYNEFNPVVRAAKVKDPRVKDTMEFYNCVVFIRENESDLSKHREFNDNSWHFYAIGNVGDDKKTDKSRVNDSKDPKECVVEITDYDVPLAEFPTGIGGDYIAPSEWKAGNTAYDNLYSGYTYDEEGKFKAFGAESYEFRYEMKGITDEQRQANIDAWRDFYRFVVTSTDKEFVANFENYFILDSALYYYLFTERYLMVDNRAKNSFWHRGKVYITQAQFTEIGEEKAKGYIVDDAKAAINDGYRWDLTFGYDFDTSLGISNTGQLVLTYGQEDVDKYANGEYIYRAAESNFFCRIRDLFADQLKGMFQSRESLRAWSSNDLIKQWDDAQSQFPEELWRLDVERKYIRTYRGVSIDNSIAGAQDPTFLEPMLNGRKKYQRRQIERNNELYFATKYVSTFAKDDFIRMRFTKPEGVAITPDYTLYLKPFTDMYITAEFGNTAPIVFRAKAGVEYPVVRKTESDTADIVLIYGASFIQAIGDLSRCYLKEGNFSKATRLQSLTIGSNAEGYKNESLTQLALENNKLLEYLDIRQATELKTVIDLSQCNNLVEFHAEGSGITGVIFANGGKLKKAYLPSIASLTMKNLQYVDTFDVSSYGSLQQLVVENVPAINTYNIVNASNILNTIRLVGINWDESYYIKDTSILDRMMSMRGIDDNGYTIPKSVLTGYFYASVVKEKDFSDYNNQWKFLNIDSGSMIEQFAVTFKNADGMVLETQYVDKGDFAVDPTKRVENKLHPTIDSTISHDFAFSHWQEVSSAIEFNFNNKIFTEITLIATYIESIREYTVTYVSKGYSKPLQQTTAPYGTSVWYSGDIPTYTAEELSYKYYLFDGWDASGYVNGDKTINAVYDSCEYRAGYFDGKELSDMRPVEIYAMTKMGLETTYIESKDALSIILGNDISYDDVEEQVLISKETRFDGTNYVDTQLQLLKEDRDFVLAIDYSFDSGNSTGNVLAQCDSYGDESSGFRLWYNSGVKLNWGNNPMIPSYVGSREMLVIRHIKGENGIHVYTSNTTSSAPMYVELSGIHSMVHDGTLVFGCSKPDPVSYEKHASGVVYWSKVWFADLGDETCANLAYWPREKMTFEMCGFKRYYLSDNSSRRSSMSFLATGVLSNQMSYGSGQSTDGGWASSTLNAYLNNRIYKALPIKWKQLVKQVKIKSSIGNQSTEVSSSDCYIAIPSVYELNSTMSQEPYYSEIYPAETISYFPNPASRICYDNNGNAVSYLTRSPNASHTNYIFIVNASGSTTGYNYPNTPFYVRIMFSI